MKKLIANFFVVVTLLSGSALFAAASPAMDVNMNNAAPAAASTANAGMYRVPSFTTNIHQVWLNGGQKADITLSGDGSTDLDLYVYDSNGALVSSSASYGDDEGVSVVANRGTYAVIKVVNRGSLYNDYQLTVSTY